MNKLCALEINDQPILTGIVVANSFFTKLRGYMFQKKPMSKGILFRHCNSLHSYFMRFDIDLYFLDSEDCLIRVEKGFSKNQMLYVKEAVHVLETPCGELGINSIEIGQKFVLKADCS